MQVIFRVLGLIRSQKSSFRVSFIDKGLELILSPFLRINVLILKLVPCPYEVVHSLAILSCPRDCGQLFVEIINFVLDRCYRIICIGDGVGGIKGLQLII